MKSNLLFDFTIDKSMNSIVAVREFDAELSFVWDAFTKPEILDQWGAPHPWRAHTIHMNFEVGGRRFYKMVNPEGQEHFSVQDYTAITPGTNLQYLSGFSDRDENINPEFYGSENCVDFYQSAAITTVRISVKYKTLATLEMMIERGYQKGFAITLDNLDKLLPTLA